jgi:hypothetical protein
VRICTNEGLTRWSRISGIKLGKKRNTSFASHDAVHAYRNCYGLQCCLVCRVPAAEAGSIRLDADIAHLAEDSHEPTIRDLTEA